MNSLVPEIQNRLAGSISWAYDRIQLELKRLVDAGLTETVPTRLGIGTPILAENYDEIPAIFRYARKHNILPVIEMLSNTGRARALIEVTELETSELFRTLCRLDEEEFGYRWIPTPPYAGFSCKRFLYNLVVDSQGWVIPCFGIEERIANVREATLEDIWRSAPLEKCRRIHDHLQGACRNCSVSRETGCYGCRGRTHVATGRKEEFA